MQWYLPRTGLKSLSGPADASGGDRTSEGSCATPSVDTSKSMHGTGTCKRCCDYGLSHADPRYSEAAYGLFAHSGWLMVQGEGGDSNELVRAQQQLVLAQQQLTSVQQQLKTAEQEVERQGLQLRNSTDDRNRLQVMTANSMQSLCCKAIATT